MAVQLSGLLLFKESRSQRAYQSCQDSGGGREGEPTLSLFVLFVCSTVRNRGSYRDYNAPGPVQSRWLLGPPESSDSEPAPRPAVGVRHRGVFAGMMMDKDDGHGGDGDLDSGSDGQRIFHSAPLAMR
eukprot:1655088-Rhodomonas_salina.1